jgi:hypothetical protein
MWHDDYREILEQLGVIPATQIQDREFGSESAGNEALIPLPLNQMDAPTHGRRRRRDDNGGGGWILKALLALSLVQTLIALLTYART